jgi:hypothetical protein
VKIEEDETIGHAWVRHLKKMYKELNIDHSMHYGNQFYVVCEELGLDPEKVKKEIEE